MLTPPGDLSPDMLAAALARGWGAQATALSYRAVGFGSHHWEVTGAAGARWFLTADELDRRRRARDEPLDGVFGRLRASLRAAAGLRDGGATFLVAPVRARDGEPLLRLAPRFAVALYPFVDGQSFAWGELADPVNRQAMLDLIIKLHTAPAAARGPADTDDFVIPLRDELEPALGSGGSGDSGGPGGSGERAWGDAGPYARPAARVLSGHAAALRRALARYDQLAAAARAGSAASVLTHGEPHPGNMMRTPDGWRLIDWDTALVAPPERDLWTLDQGDGSALRDYAAATGVTPRRPVLDLYRLRWDLADIALYASRFRGPHRGDEDDDKSWWGLRSTVGRLARCGAA